jgi:hypothetical protein
MSCFDQRFAGNASKMQAVTTQFFFFFYEQGFGTKLGGTGRNG